MERKVCTKCDKVKPLADFAPDKRRPSGLGSHCRECKRETSALYRGDPQVRKRRNAQSREYQRENGERYEGRYDQSAYTATLKAWHERNPNAQKAYNKLHRAIRKGIMQKAANFICSHCGNSATEYHHHNGYDVGHELDVIPLCHSCHKLTHGAYS